MVGDYLRLTNGIIRRSDNILIPTDPGNRDFQEYQAWLEAGNAPDELPPPTPAENLATNIQVRNSLLGIATLAIDPLKDAIDLDIATENDGAMLGAWKLYRVLVNRTDLNVLDPTWPTQPI
ncbi:tail fiber assembly protein [Pseudomonas lutea]|uniref:tail fiber assembly protein n=1 Tax=Pseudomonas lutea TaxID=243924 RepID=UPI00068F2133|nr:tail fiber assembly protein [Pseudomonas lutea]